jgi:hypothetical protein
MNWDILRLRLALGGEGEPDRSPKRFAPYPVWAWARAVGAASHAAFPLALVFAILGWPTMALIAFAFWFVVFLPIPRYGLTPLTPEIIGGLLGSRYCPACGQSIFDRAPPTGYMADHARGTWWPHRHCANCGHDLKVRTSD